MYPVTVAVFLTTLPAVHVLPSFTVIFTVAPFRDDSDNGAIGAWLLQLTVDPAVQIIAVVVQVSFLLTIAQLTLFPDGVPTRVVSAGSISLTTTPTAFDPPRFPTPIE